MAEEGQSRELDSTTIVTSVHCQRCGYDLRGLSPLGRCPECGLDTWQTILKTVDPAGSGLPKIRNPGRVGDGLLLLMILLLVAGLGTAARPIAVWIEDSMGGGAFAASRWIPSWAPIAAGALGLQGIWAVMMIAPPRGKEPPGPVWRDIGLLGCGVVAWSMLIMIRGFGDMLGWDQTTHGLLSLLMCPAAGVGLLGLNGILATIGLRSRQYRTSRGGRQSAQAMIAAALFGAVGQALLLTMAPGSASTALESVGLMLVYVSQVMLVIGMAYLVANAWWIRRALRRPPPILDSILAEIAQRPTR